MHHEMLSQRAPFCIGTMAEKGMLSQHFVTHVVPPLGEGTMEAHHKNLYLFYKNLASNRHSTH